MKIIFFGLFVVVCAFQFTNGLGTSSHENDVQRFKLNLQFLTKSLNVFGSKSYGELSNKVAALSKSHVQSLNNDVESALKEVRSAVDAAKQEGKDVESCFSTADAALKKVRTDGQTKAKKCVTESMQMAASVLSLAKSTSSAVGQEQRKIEKRFKDCSTIISNSAKSFCYNLAVKESEKEILDLAKEVQVARGLVHQAAEDTPDIAESCLKNVHADVTKTATASKTEASKCVESASATPSV